MMGLLVTAFALALGNAALALGYLDRFEEAELTPGDVVLAAPAVWVEFFSRYEAWWIDGLALVAGATGVALCWTGLTGARPDWIDD